ncbi:MAG: kinase/pyrophosphorylase [Gemmatimonadetes bacterium]|nr:kinase/pyrophosphorylase [Gemmatimonadota bacterium]
MTGDALPTRGASAADAAGRFHVFAVSDGTGDTVEKMARAALLQFDQADVVLHRINRVRSQTEVNEVLERAVAVHGIVVHTLVDEIVRRHLNERARHVGIPAVDLLGPLLDDLGHLFAVAPRVRPGLFHQVNETYFKRIDAIEFTLKHDDGQALESMHEADVILVGISRTSKTPLSVYLAHEGYRTANVPLVQEIGPPHALFQADQKRIAALTIDPEHLQGIRRERLRRYSHPEGHRYADLRTIEAELDWSREIFRQNRLWPVIDVTGKAIEETANEVLKALGLVSV